MLTATFHDSSNLFPPKLVYVNTYYGIFSLGPRYASFDPKPFQPSFTWINYVGLLLFPLCGNVGEYIRVMDDAKTENFLLWREINGRMARRALL